MKKLVIKLGGSEITDKKSEGFPLRLGEIKSDNITKNFIRTAKIRKIGEILSTAREKYDLQLFIVNGVGPYGHDLVHAHWDGKGVTAETIHSSVAFLNKYLCTELEEQGLPMYSIPPFETCSYFGDDEFDISGLYLKALRTIEDGKIPSAYGDLVERKKRVISGDDLITDFANRWIADKVISISNIPGIYIDNNHRVLGIFDELIAGEDGSFKSKDGSDVRFGVFDDVTGGLRRKLRKLSDLVYRTNIPSVITNTDGLEAALHGEKVGTLIRRE